MKAWENTGTEYELGSASPCRFSMQDTFDAPKASPGYHFPLNYHDKPRLRRPKASVAYLVQHVV